MNIIQNLKDKTKEWIFTIALKKAITRIAQLIISYLSAKGITIVYKGIPVDVNTLTTILMGLIEIIRNYLKTKFPNKFGWL
jgi:uncharacterized membrane protein